jgi:hypothetical protein
MPNPFESTADFFRQNQCFSHDLPVFADSDFQIIKNYFMNYVQSIPEPLRYLNCANDPRFLPAIADWVGRDEILNIVKPILGSDIIFWSLGVCYKPPHSEYEVGWHIDSHCWMRDQVIFPAEALVLFFSLTEMNLENGGLQLIPQLNTPKFYDHTARDKNVFFFEHEISEEQLPLNQAQVFEMKENRICGFASHVPHRSGPNRSDKPRLGLTLRYLHSSVQITGTPLDGRDSYLISGVDHAGNNYASIETRKSIGGLSSKTYIHKEIA